MRFEKAQLQINGAFTIMESIGNANDMYWATMNNLQCLNASECSSILNSAYISRSLENNSGFNKLLSSARTKFMSLAEVRNRAILHVDKWRLTLHEEYLMERN